MTQITLHPGVQFWHLDVPLTYPLLPAGAVFTLALGTDLPLAAESAAGDLVLGLAEGRLVMAAQIENHDAPPALPMVVEHFTEAVCRRTHLTAVRVRAIDILTDVFHLPHWPEFERQQPDGDATSIFGVATRLPPDVAGDLAKLLLPPSPVAAPAQPARPRKRGGGRRPDPTLH